MILDARQPFLLGSDAPPPPPTSGITPRAYQVEGITAARRILAEQVRRLLLVLATGGGKTVVAALVALGAMQKGKRVLFVGPRREIIAQAFWKLIEAGIPEMSCGVIMADGIIPHVSTRQPYRAKRPMAPVQVASVQTLANWKSLPPFDVVFIDEAHHATSPTWSRIIDHYRESGAIVIGLTATPCRADGKGLGGLFKHLHVIASFRDLAEHPRGPFLVAPRTYTTPNQPDLSKVEINRETGEYVQKSAAAAMDRRELVGDVVEHYQRLGAGRRGVVFAASVEHSRHITEAFVAAGIAAEHLDGGTDTDLRDAILARLKRDVPLLLHAGVVAPVTSREAAARLDRRAQHEAEKQAAECAETLTIIALWERTLAALRVDAPALDQHAPRAPEYYADRLHNVARDAAPWLHYGGRFTRCERCGGSARGTGTFAGDCSREAQFILIHVRCEMPAHDGAELDADIVIDHDRTDGTTVWPIGGHWTHVIARALGPRAEWGRAYGKRFVPVIGSRRLDAPVIDVVALAEDLRRAGARVHVTPSASVKRCDVARSEAA